MRCGASRRASRRPARRRGSRVRAAAHIPARARRTLQRRALQPAHWLGLVLEAKRAPGVGANLAAHGLPGAVAPAGRSAHLQARRRRDGRLAQEPGGARRAAALALALLAEAARRAAHRAREPVPRVRLPAHRVAAGPVRRVDRWEDGLPDGGRVHAVAPPLGLAELPHALPPRLVRVLPAVARLAAADPRARARLPRLRARHPLPAVPDAGGHHGHQRQPDLLPHQAGRGPRRPRLRLHPTVGARAGTRACALRCRAAPDAARRAA